jgi:hypothetical protein
MKARKKTAAEIAEERTRREIEGKMAGRRVTLQLHVRCAKIFRQDSESLQAYISHN